MNVRWCKAHTSNQIADDMICWAADSFGTPCHFVEMQLAPLDARIVGAEALVIEKVDGEWELSARVWHVLNAIAAFGVPSGSLGLLHDLENALALKEPSEAP